MTRPKDIEAFRPALRAEADLARRTSPPTPHTVANIASLRVPAVGLPSAVFPRPRDVVSAFSNRRIPVQEVALGLLASRPAFQATFHL